MEHIVSHLSNEGEMLGFVENCLTSNIYCKIPIIPPIISQKNLKISSKYGYRIHPIFDALKFHNGIDIVAETDTIVVTADGVVEQMGYQNGLGLFILVKHQYGFMTLYGHLNVVFVKPNQAVQMAQAIGLVGNTGLVMGKYLHYSVIKNGFYLNPFFMMYLYLKVLDENINSP
jgi:murein DD-endopeptidase MepM/ murein hydrolase activator NlpD